MLLEVDELWSFVGQKKRQRWLWYAFEPRAKRIVAHVFGRRTEQTLKKLFHLLQAVEIQFVCTDAWPNDANQSREMAARIHAPDW